MGEAGTEIGRDDRRLMVEQCSDAFLEVHCKELVLVLHTWCSVDHSYMTARAQP